MPTPEREWPRADSEIAAGAFVGASGRKTRMSAFGGKADIGQTSENVRFPKADIAKALTPSA
jgi:hypothetical protein